ncbi:hypothetical protein KFL_001090080 [Klebsormidium nitens]|uniref:Uridine diphosphate glucose pyrophosphatase NUDT14 n=1 Tax=Klebsormidium nitens TaxID=105231 RepID=A0A1Y1HYT9_KLENI|nr:hypothetical protein KFL_001090080 [Klebsormidium nitens]|eukprot:GAQ82359.1 hypothetical protein KFL_001090080 [Klebsormidium nitens]
MASAAVDQGEVRADEGPTPASPSGPGYELIGKSGVKIIDIAAKGLEVTANSISGLRVEPLPGPSAFVKPKSIYFQQQTRKRRWDMVESHPSVSILLYHKGFKAALLVRQFRPAVYVSETKRVQLEEGPTATLPLTGAFTYELCAGIVDKPGLKLEEIAKEEIREECGYDIPLQSIRKLTSWLSAVGISGARQTCYYAEIDESMRAGRGGGNLVEGEEIDVVALPVDQIDKFIMDESIPKSTGVI